MVTGWLTWDGNTYYLRPADVAAADGCPEGSMIAGRTERIGDAATGQYYTFNGDGALQGGRVDQNPLGNLVATGWRRGLDANGNAGGGWYFYRSDGTQVAGGWELIGNGTDAGGSRWYYFNSDGTMKTGWLKWNDEWYWLTTANGNGDPRTTTTGQMVTGFVTIGTTPEGIAVQKTYFFKSNGALNGKGWIKTNNRWYYLNNDGTIVTGWFRDGTKWYYLRDDSNPVGEMVTGVFNVPATLLNGNQNNPNGTQSFKANGEWIGSGAQPSAAAAGYWGKDGNGKWHYYDVNNVPVTGWLFTDDKWYYLDPGSNPVGIMATDWRTIDGQRFYFNSEGVLQSGWQKLSGVWYYLNPNHDGNFGAAMIGWQMIGGEWYYFAESGNIGAMQTGWIENPVGSNKWYYLNTANDGTEGAMHKGGWMKVGDKWFYLNPNHDGEYGRPVQGWVQDGGYTYYMQASTNPAEGWMLTGGPYVIDGKTCTFDGDGHLISQT